MTRGFLLTLFSLLVLAVNPLFSQNDVKSTLIGTPTDDERAANIVADNAGNTYVGGIQNKKGLIVKQNALHQTLWSKTLTFTTNPNHKTVVTFLDLVGDTVFGCGTIRQGNQQWPFYFKLNAQTGTPYWSKYDLISDGFFSSMRYANGKFFLVGSIYGTGQSILGKAIAVSSQTGNLVWETPLMYGVTPNAVFSAGGATVFLSATELYNGKFYVTGYCFPAQTIISGGTGGGSFSRPLLVGISENGTVFMEKWLNMPQIETMTWYNGQKIHLDADKNLVIGSYRMNATAFNNIVITKCDTIGNVLFSNGYRIDNSYALVPIDALNETSDSYVAFGVIQASVSGQYALKINKNGIIQKSIVIYKPNTSSYSLGGMDILSWHSPSGAGVFGGGMNGNSRFLNGSHYFVSSEAEISSSMNYDINQIILDEELEFVDNCSELIEVPTSVNNVPTTVDPLAVTNYPHTMVLQNGIILEDIPDYNYCDNISLDLVQHPGCEESVLTANHAGFTDPTFYWSDGTVSTSNVLAVNSTDTIFLRVLDTKCCELLDTIIPSIVPSALTMSLPADTTVCLQFGNTFTISPTFSGANAPVQYLWSNNSTGASLSVTNPGTYWVEISDSCLTLRDSIVVLFNSLPVIGNATNTTICEDDFPAILNPTVSAGAGVLWDDGTIAPNRTVNGPGTYTIAAINDCGTVSASISVTQTNLPDVQLISLIDTCIPTGGTIVLIPTFSDVNSVLWSGGSTGNQLSVSTSGSYTVYGSNVCGIDSATSVVTLNFLPVIGNTSNVTICEDDFPATLNPTVSAGASVLWNDGTITVSRTVTGPGAYTIAATNNCGTVNSTISVSQSNLPDVQLISSVDTCILTGGTVALIPTLTDVTNVLWSDGSSANQLLVSTSGSYTVYGSNVCGIDSATCSVTINHFPEMDLPAVLDTCFDIGVGFSYTASGSPGSYQWSSGSQTAAEWISQEGVYSCTLTNSCGSITDSMQVRRFSEIDLYFPEDSIKVCEKHLSVSLLHIETNYNMELVDPEGGLVGTHLSESGWYHIRGFNACNEIWDSIYVNLQNEQFFYLPNSFTPNADGNNDRFEFKGENVVIRDVRIFNRWGEEIFTESGSFTGWDGSYLGETCPDGIYAVHLIYEDCFGMPTVFKGHVNLVR
jgi:gliding motility-associated-like protein